MAFRGTFEYTLDAKNRLTVPARFRAVLSDGVVIAAGFEPCVQIWIPAEYDVQGSVALAGLNPISPEARELRRFFSANAHDTELDAAGRVMLPPPLIEHASLNKDVVVTGAGDCLEIWDRAAWTAYNDGLPDRVTDITAGLAHPS